MDIFLVFLFMFIGIVAGVCITSAKILARVPFFISSTFIVFALPALMIVSNMPTEEIREGNHLGLVLFYVISAFLTEAVIDRVFLYPYDADAENDDADI
jgi:hypothetical protein